MKLDVNVIDQFDICCPADDACDECVEFWEQFNAARKRIRFHMVLCEAMFAVSCFFVGYLRYLQS